MQNLKPEQYCIDVHSDSCKSWFCSTFNDKVDQIECLAKSFDIDITSPYNIRNYSNLAGQPTVLDNYVLRKTKIKGMEIGQIKTRDKFQILNVDFPLNFCINPAYPVYSYVNYCYNKFYSSKSDNINCYLKYCLKCCENGKNVLKYAIKKMNDKSYNKKYQYLLENKFIIEIIINKKTIDKCSNLCQKYYPKKIIIPYKFKTKIPLLGLNVGTNYRAYSCSDIYQHNEIKENRTYFIDMYWTLVDEIPVYCLNNVGKSKEGGWTLIFNYFVPPGAKFDIPKESSTIDRFIQKENDTSKTISKSDIEKDDKNKNEEDKNIEPKDEDNKVDEKILIKNKILINNYHTVSKESYFFAKKKTKVEEKVEEKVKEKVASNFEHYIINQKKKFYKVNEKINHDLFSTNSNYEKLEYDPKFEFKLNKEKYAVKDKAYPIDNQEEKFFKLQNKHIDLKRFEYYKDNRIQDILFMCTIFQEKPDDIIQKELVKIIDYYKENKISIESMDEESMLMKIKKYTAIGFIGFSTQRRKIGNYSLNTSLFDVVINDINTNLAPADFTDLEQWGPHDFPQLDFIDFDDNLLVNKILDDDLGDTFSVYYSEKNGYAGDPFNKKGNFYWTVDRDHTVMKQYGESEDTEHVFNCDSNFGKEEIGKYFSIHQIYVRDKKVSKDEASERYEKYVLERDKEFKESDHKAGKGGKDSNDIKDDDQ